MRGLLLLGLGVLGVAEAEELVKGSLIASVACAADPSQTYALYVPSNYTPDRAWPLLVGFDPRARGTQPVERYQKAAEMYGYIVAGSNNSRNGSWESSQRSIQAMFADLPARFHIDGKRVYAAGMSGGARVATQLALATGKITGVVASSAGLPDGRPRKTVPFLVYGTAGTEDFNYLEMKELDRTLTSPHHVAIFEGGHVWLSPELATGAVEWLELEAMKAGSRERDQALIDRLFEKRAAAAGEAAGVEAWRQAASLAADFKGLHDVAKFETQAEELRRGKQVKEALKKEDQELQREKEMLREIYQAEAGMATPENKSASLSELRALLGKLAKQANGASDTVERRLARRVTRGVALGVAERVPDPAYKKMLDELGLATRFPRQ